MNIGSYTLVKKQIIEELEEENKQKEKILKEHEKHVEGLEKRLRKFERCIPVLEECKVEMDDILMEHARELKICDLFLDCLLNNDIKKAIGIYNRTKSIRIKEKSLNSISKKVEKIKQVTSL
ncbi:hypothetical protein [Clostridioides phage CD2301]|uniref:Uncharacterized protein n=1 Tax=Clostridioides difficile TaxID=1496 RepID=A0AAN5VSG4_CLODI|nr:hypothetical protein [Clostridioides difficile]QVW56683.1 hypothetical protein [Clostridioides phage CD2301]MCU5837717.1 hypothetical protein [Clostridioides difficile]MDB0373442.1 hypothetical protein [Clostridioides difficile]MDB0374849.1 hypothetical protein [Clostridioides difficile]MDB2861878.1 hypothetical protein [Clostridioides difficile]